MLRNGLYIILVMEVLSIGSGSNFSVVLLKEFACSLIESGKLLKQEVSAVKV